MEIAVHRSDPAEVEKLHPLYRQQANCQIIHDAFWACGWVDAFLIEIDRRVAGYGGVATRHDPGTLMEFYVFPEFERHTMDMGRKLLAVCGATHLEAQTNIPWMKRLLDASACDIVTGSRLFAEHHTTHLPAPEGALFRRRREEGELARGDGQPADGQWVIELDGCIVASGGVLTHYNPPYGDIYMEVDEAFRRRGIGSYLVQELKRAAYQEGRLPAARCNSKNLASRKTLQRAGFAICGEMQVGRLRP